MQCQPVHCPEMLLALDPEPTVGPGVPSLRLNHPMSSDWCCRSLVVVVRAGQGQPPASCCASVPALQLPGRVHGQVQGAFQVHFSSLSALGVRSSSQFAQRCKETGLVPSSSCFLCGLSRSCCHLDVCATLVHVMTLCLLLCEGCDRRPQLWPVEGC